MEKIDCIIIGAGPAGIMAGIYLKRSNIKNVVIFDNGDSSLEKADSKIENLYGFQLISSKELFLKGKAQAEKLGLKIINENVVHVDYDFNTNDVVVSTPSNIYFAKTLLFATGKKRQSLNIPGIKELEGRGISYCATCDGFFYRKKDVVVIGSKDFAIREYDFLKNIAHSVVLCSNGEKADVDFDYENRKIIEIRKDNDKIIIVFDDKTELYVDGAFIAIGNASSSDFAKQLGINISENNDIVVDQNCKTNYDNIYAAGDCTGGILQISKAEYQGMISGMEIGKFLRKKQ